MARYPTFDEYREKPAKGIQRCDELLKRDPSNVTVLLTKLQLQVLREDSDAAEITLNKLLTSQPAITDLSEISTIEEAVVQLQSATIYPTPLSAGPELAKLWDVAYRAATNVNFKLDLQSLRCTRAIIDNRHADAQQALIQLKALLPKTRVFYMAHAAVTQLLSTSSTDLQSRLALSLARKAVNDKFDEDTTLDCRVPGQIFALQSSQVDIDAISGGRFADSKQISDYSKRSAPTNGRLRSVERVDPVDVSSREWLDGELAVMKQQFGQLLEVADQEKLSFFAANCVRLFVLATGSLALRTYRPVSEAIFLAISALVKIWTWSPDQAFLLQSVYLADALLQIQPKVHEAKVILVYLYMRLGLGRLAYIQWDSLSTKEIQYDTFGHTFLSQLSIIHPHYLGDIDPDRIITHGLSIYRRWEDKTAETHASVLSHGQTGMIFDLYELRECLRLSATRRILSLEYRRLARLNNKPLIHNTMHCLRLTDAWLDTRDNRDFAAAFNYGVDVERILHDQDQLDTWILLGLATDAIWCMSTNQLAAVKDAAKILVTIGASTAMAPEYQQVVLQLITLLLESLTTGIATTKDQVLFAVDSLHIHELIAETTTLPDHVRNTYLYLDTMLVLTAYAKHAESKKLLGKSDANALRDRAHKEVKRLQAYCQDQISAVSAKTVRSVLLPQGQDSVLAELHISPDDLNKFCEHIADGAKDAWNGASQYKC